MEKVIKEFSYGSEDYIKSLEIRNEVLRKPLGRDIKDDILTKDITARHVGAYADGVLIGVVVVEKLDDENMKMRQFAVLEPYQKCGFGRMMVEFYADIAREMHCKYVVCHAREVAVEFYKKCGYEIIGERFFEVGIPHFNARYKV